MVPVAMVCFFAAVAKQEKIADIDTISKTPEHNLADAFVYVAENSRPAVVHIRAETVSQAQRKDNYGGEDSSANPFEDFQEELFHRFFGFPGGPLRRGPNVHERPPQVNSGSGFIVSSDGYILTNYHVVKDMNKIYVEIFDVDREFEAQCIGCDPKTDLAVLKIAEKNLPYLSFADSDQLKVGQWSVAIGHPFKLRDTVTHGIISAVHRVDLQISPLEDFIQTDASINPGNSGGPLLDLKGQVIGVNTAILSKTGGNLGVGFAVPSNIALMVYEQIKQNGCVDRGFLGVQIQDLNESLCDGFNVKKSTTGALIAEVIPNSCAEEAGLKRGDIVVSFNEKQIKSAKQLYTNLGKLAPGSLCKLHILRYGKPVNMELVLGSRKKETSEEGDIIHKLGIIVEQLNAENAHKYFVKSDERGVVITEILPSSLASLHGWNTGSIIKVVNGEDVTSITDLKAILQKASPKQNLVFLLSFQGRVGFYSIPHPESS